MKRFMAMILTAVLLTGCGGTAENAAQAVNTTENLSDARTGETTSAENIASGTAGAAPQQMTIDGSTYTMPAGWVEHPTQSVPDRTYYVMDGHINDSMPDNFAVRVGENYYSPEQHEEFRDVILKVLNMQLPVMFSDKATLKASGSTTKNGDILYIFEIDDRSNPGHPCSSTEYYVVGDHKYFCVSATDYSGSDASHKAAAEIADSFVW